MLPLSLTSSGAGAITCKITTTSKARDKRGGLWNCTIKVQFDPFPRIPSADQASTITPPKHDPTPPPSADQASTIPPPKHDPTPPLTTNRSPHSHFNSTRRTRATWLVELPHQQHSFVSRRWQGGCIVLDLGELFVGLARGCA
jgi:hypothetical protein